MPARKPLPDLRGVDPTELQLAILVVLEERLGPKRAAGCVECSSGTRSPTQVVRGACCGKRWRGSGSAAHHLVAE
jgi:hypothetical protein